MNNYKVYLHTIPSSVTGYSHDKYYVGITSKKYIKDRWGYKGNGYKDQVFYKAIKKYGWDNISHKILLENLSSDEAKKIETALITALCSDINHNGYNLTSGGDGIKNCMSQKHRNIYCYELNAVFKNVNVASAITGDKASSIRNRCRAFENGKVQEKIIIKFSYCYIEQMYKLYDKRRMSHCSKPVISTKDGQLYGSSAIADNILGIHTNPRSVLSYTDYLKKKNNYSLYKKEYLMYTTDYLMIEDLSRIC